MFIVVVISVSVFCKISVILTSAVFLDCRIEEKVLTFWKEADFGYVKKFRDSLRTVCKPKTGEVRRLTATINIIML